MNIMFEINIIIVSLGLIFATVSLISGLQSVKKAGIMIARMHRLNGYIACLIYLIAAVLSLKKSGDLMIWPAMWWIAGLAVIVGKILAVRNQRTYKYGSRLGMLLFIIWLIIIYNHLIA